MGKILLSEYTASKRLVDDLATKVGFSCTWSSPA